MMSGSPIVSRARREDTMDKVERVNANFSAFRWRVKRFSKVKSEIQNSVLSPHFSSIDSKIKWALRLYPHSTKTVQSEFMSIGIYYHSYINVLATVELSVVNIDNEVLEAFTVEKEMLLISSTKNLLARDEDYFKFARRSDIENPTNRILANDCLMISFDVTLHDPIVMIPTIKEKDKSENKLLMEFDGFGRLLEDGKLSDVTFVVDNKKIRAHKAILAIRSPVFDAMFQHEMQESKQNIVEIVDIDYAVLMEMFKFMYTGKVDDIQNVARDLLIAAEKYCVDRLKALCEETLLKNLKIDNVLECLVVADNSNAVTLKRGTLEFIVNHSVKVVESEEFDLLCPKLMREVTRALARNANTH